MKVYKLKHLPTGMYFIPSREIKITHPTDKNSYGYVKSNLSKVGKVYLKKPSFAYIKYGFYNPAIIRWIPRDGTGAYPINAVFSQYIPSEWVIEEF